MNTFGKLAIVTLAAVLTLPASAGDMRPLHEAKSDSGEYVLRIELGRDTADHARACRGLLLHRPRTGTRKTLWDRPFVNDVAPLRAFVRDDGRFVVTLDEYRRGGARHALVIYGHEGQMLRHFVLSDLLEGDDWRHVSAGKRAVEWLKDAKCGFNDDQTQFVILTSWNREIRVDLAHGQLLGRRRMQGTQRLAAIPGDVRAVLFGEEPAATSRVPNAVRQESPRDQTATRSVDETDDEARAITITRPDAPPDVPDEMDEKTLVEPDEELAGDIGAPPIDEPALDEPVSPPAPIVLKPSGGVPLPNPADPVDYVAWMNTRLPRDGESGAAHYAKAFARFVEWDGDASVLRSALGGDADALSNPELRAWLRKNEDALASFQKAARCVHAGLHYESDESGRLIGVSLPHISPMRDMAKAMIVAGKRLELEGQGTEAATLYVDTLGAAAHVGTGATLVEGLVGVTMRSLAQEALLALYAGDQGDELDSVSLAQKLDNARLELRPLDDVLKAERAAILDITQQLFQADVYGRFRPDPLAASQLAELIGGLGPKPGEALLLRESALNRLKFDATVQEINVYFDALTDAAHLPYPDGNSILSEVERHIDSDDANALLRIIAPSFKRSLAIRARNESQFAGLRLLTHLRSYQQKHDTYPASLDKLGPAGRVTDPLSNRPFVYRRVKDDIQLYSLGADGIDSGGIHDPSGERSDYVIWPRPTD